MPGSRCRRRVSALVYVLVRVCGRCRCAFSTVNDLSSLVFRFLGYYNRRGLFRSTSSGRKYSDSHDKMAKSRPKSAKCLQEALVSLTKRAIKESRGSSIIE